jgi:hypothetical protein
VTADGRIICIAADVVEAAVALDQLDAVAVVAAAVVEAADALDAVDGAVGAQALFATVAEAADALDALDGLVRRKPAYGGGYYRPALIVGVGFGVLSPLRGEAHGEVVIAGTGAVVVPIVATATGEVDDWPDDVELMLLMLAA